MSVPPPPIAAEDLLRFLRTSPSAKQVEAAARHQGLLSAAAPDVEPLRVLMGALAIPDLETLERSLAATLEDLPALYAALERRVRAGKSGDLAHWVGVALLGLDLRVAEPDLDGLARFTEWDDAYVRATLQLRALADRGELREAALGLAAGTEGAGESTGDAVSVASRVHEVTLDPPLEGTAMPRARVRRNEGFWPVLAAVGGSAIIGTVALGAGEELRYQSLRFRARAPGVATVREAVEAPRLEIAALGRLRPTGETVAFATGDRPPLALELPGHGHLVWTGEDELALLPWQCCWAGGNVDGDWWLQLADGPAAGGWVTAPRRVVGLEFPAYTAWLEELRESMRRQTVGGLREGGAIEVEGARIIYGLVGDPATQVDAERPPLFVLHGGPGLGSHYLREALVRTLTRERTLVFYDQRGSGASSGADDPSYLALDWFVDDLEKLRRHSEQGRIDLLGHSFGGLLALAYALEHPDRVRRIVLVDPDPPWRAGWETFRARVAARTAPADAAALAAIEADPDWRDDPEAVMRWFELRMPAYFADPAAAASREWFLAPEIAEKFMVTAPPLRASLGEWDLRPRLTTLASPVLVLGGGASIFDPSTHDELAAVLPAGRRVVLDGSGHFPFFEQPDAFARTVLEFLAEGESGR